MGVCTFRDKNSYFSRTSEREARLEMLQRYLQREKMPHIPPTAQGTSESSEMVSEEVDGSSEEEPVISSIDGVQAEGSQQFSDNVFEPDEVSSGDNVPPLMEEPQLYGATSPGQFTPSTSQEEAAFVFLRGKQQSQSFDNAQSLV